MYDSDILADAGGPSGPHQEPVPTPKPSQGEPVPQPKPVPHLVEV